MVEGKITTPLEVTEVLEALHYKFPAVLNLEIPESPYVLFSWGKVGDTKFEWHYGRAELRARVKVITREIQEQTIITAWRRLKLVQEHPRLLIALRYFRSSCRLLKVGKNRFEFIPEAILNLSKCLQALFGERRDDVRVGLQKVGISSEESEALFVPSLFLRDSFDVAHISLTEYSREQLDTLHAFVELAEPAFRRLLSQVVDMCAAGEWIPAAVRVGEPDAKERQVIDQMKQNLKPFSDRAIRGQVELDQKGTKHPAFDASYVGMVGEHPEL